MPFKDKQKYNEYMRNYVLKRYHERRKKAIEYLGGKCIDCKTQSDLEFDHIEQSTKKFSIAKLSSVSEKLFWQEIEKCVLRCNLCHIERSKRQRTCPVP